MKYKALWELGIRSVTTGDKRTNSKGGRTHSNRCWSKACPWSERVWQPQIEALFDMRIIDTDATSYKLCTPEAVLESAAKDYIRKQ